MLAPLAEIVTLSDTCRHVQFADRDSCCDDVGLIVERAVEEGCIEGSGRSRGTPISRRTPCRVSGAGPGKVSIHLGIYSRRESSRQQQRAQPS